MENILKKIITKKKEKIIDFKNNYSINNLLDNIKNINNFIDFKSEIKKRDAKIMFGIQEKIVNKIIKK